MRPKLAPVPVLAFVAVFGCKGGDRAGEAATASAPAPAGAAPEQTAPAAGKCKASGDKPVQLGTITGDVYGFAVDATSLYYSSWELYGQRGDVGVIRKDGEPTPKLTSLDLEPRGLALDDAAV